MDYAGFWQRFFASWIDSVILVIASWGAYLGLLGAAFWLQIELSGFAEQVAVSAAYMVLSIAYYLVGHWKWGTTLGKRALSVYVRDAADPSRPITFGQSALRCVGYVLSSLPLCAGYLLAAFHPRKQALHDLLAGTVCVRAASQSSRENTRTA